MGLLWICCIIVCHLLPVQTWYTIWEDLWLVRVKLQPIRVIVPWKIPEVMEIESWSWATQDSEKAIDNSTRRRGVLQKELFYLHISTNKHKHRLTEKHHISYSISFSLICPLSLSLSPSVLWWSVGNAALCLNNFSSIQIQSDPWLNAAPFSQGLFIE